MRILFLILALLNVGYYFYTRAHSKQPGQNHQSGPTQLVPGIKTLEVIPKAKLSSMGSPEAKESKPSEARPFKPQTRKPKKVDSPVTQTPPPKPANKPHLLTAKPVNVCYTFGPVNSDKTANDIMAYLKGKASDTSIRRETRKSVSGYWVYLKSYKTLEAAKRVALQLKQDNVKQNFIVPSGQYLNAISLGLFKDQADANRRITQIRKLGFTPIMSVKYNNQPLYWVNYETPPSSNVSPALSLGKGQMAGNPKKMRRVCPLGKA